MPRQNELVFVPDKLFTTSLVLGSKAEVSIIQAKNDFSANILKPSQFFADKDLFVINAAV